VRGTDQVAVTFFGEGATSMGVVHESMNLAAVWRLPVVFVCENNGYAQATPSEYALACDRVADRAAAYRMPGVRVDGQDVLAVFAAADEAVRRARAGGGPSLVECMTYRFHGHHQGDDTLRYRLADEERAARERDPIPLFRARLLSGGIGAETLDAIDAQNRATLDEAVAFAEASPLPGPEDLLLGVYADQWAGPSS
jgi:pyruvate dehydrogenase E1 component alpha subunit